MKNIIQIFATFLLLTIFTFNKCKKDKGVESKVDNPYGLPNATQIGANTFACRVNGVNWISKNDIYSLGAFVSSDTLSLGGGGGGIPFEKLFFFIRSGQQGVQYRLNDLLNSSGGVFIGNDVCLGRTLTKYTNDGSLTITKYDISNKIVSGTFNCLIPIPQCDTLKITDGRFDIRFHN